MLPPREHPPALPSPAVHHRGVRRDTAEYLGAHNIKGVLHEIVERVCVELPADPIAFMRTELGRLQVRGGMRGGGGRWSSVACAGMRRRRAPSRSRSLSPPPLALLFLLFQGFFEDSCTELGRLQDAGRFERPLGTVVERDALLPGLPVSYLRAHLEYSDSTGALRRATFSRPVMSKDRVSRHRAEREIVDRLHETFWNEKGAKQACGEEGVGTLQVGTMMSVLINLEAGMDDDAALHAKFEELCDLRDHAGKPCLSKAGLCRVLAKLRLTPSEAEAQDMLAQLDLNRDGHIDFDEFRAAVTTQSDVDLFLKSLPFWRAFSAVLPAGMSGLLSQPQEDVRAAAIKAFPIMVSILMSTLEQHSAAQAATEQEKPASGGAKFAFSIAGGKLEDVRASARARSGA